MTALPKPTCRATKKSGHPCRSALNLSPDGLCLQHDPERAEAARAMRLAGGVASSAAARERKAAALPSDAPRAPKTIADAVKFAAYVSHALAAGTLDAKTGTAITSALNGFRAGVTQKELERKSQRLTALVDRIQKCPACAELARKAKRAE